MAIPPNKPKISNEIRTRLFNKNWRIRSLYSITGKDAGATLKFRPNRAQMELLQAMQEHKRIIVLKARQLGITTVCAVSFLDDVLFTRNLTALTIMQTRDHAIAAFDGKVRFAWENFDKKLKDALGWKVDTERANQLTFGFGGGMYSSYAVGTSGRSGTFQRVHISEFSKVCRERPLDAKEIITGTLPAVPQDGLIVMESTAEGEDGAFADYWRDAAANKNGWYPIFFNWQYDDVEIAKAPAVDVYDLPLEFQKLAEIHKLTPKEISYYHGRWLLLGRDWQALREQYPTTAEDAFATSGDKLFDLEAIAEYEAQTLDGKKAGNTTVYEPFREGRTYVIGADVAEGVGEDSSAAVVWRLDGPSIGVAATFASNTISEEDFAFMLKELALLYGNATLAVERNNTGIAVLAKLRDIYDEGKLYRDTDVSGVLRPESSKYGFRTTSASKPLILSEMKQAVSERAVRIPSKALLLEMRMCPRSEMTRTVGQVTRHYDLLMAASIGYHARAFALTRSDSSMRAETSRQRIASDPYSPI